MSSYEQQYAKRTFSALTHKEAYMKAIKWIAKNIISNDELKDTEVKFVKDYMEGSKLPTITIILSVGIDEKEIKNQHCKCCKEFHKLFFINENCNCDWCNTKGFQDRCQFMLKGKKEYYKELLEGKKNV